ncbi:MAG TPA: hypothetical protein VE688_00055 [Gaiellaceae bacterium]|nr:hypothetical protein [Gaiellaceae bacterium]
MSRLVEGEGGNREVPPPLLVGERGGSIAAIADANLEEEGGSWGKHGFPHATEPEAEEQPA